MPSNSSTENNATSSSGVSGQFSEAVSTAQNTVSDLGRAAANKVDENRDAAASGLRTAASTLHDAAEKLPGGDTVSSFAQSAADKLNSTADYVRDHDVNRMMDDVERLVKNNPGPALFAAAAIGFLVGRTLSRD